MVEGSRTEPGTSDNRITAFTLRDPDGKIVPSAEFVGAVRTVNGTLTVTNRKLTVTAISGSLTTDGKEIVASTLQSPDGSFSGGYRAEGLASGHRLSGNFVTGRGTSGFTTSIDRDALRVLDAYNNDVTAYYDITTVSGYITINAAQKANVSLTVTARSKSFVYDGNEHSCAEYDASGLVDGDQIEKVNFKSDSVITNVGTHANEIQSVVIKSSSGSPVDSSKYSIRYVPGTLTVTRFPLTLTAVSDEKDYDGKALNNKNVKSSALANPSHKLSADYEVYDSNGNSIKNGPLDVGVYTKKVGNVKITAGAQDVTANYDIKTEDGTLTIRAVSSGSGKGSSPEVNTAYYGSTFTLRSDAPYSEFQYLLIDGQRISAEHFSVREGSTIITLKASYVQSLKTGSHNYTIVSTSKQVDGSFKVAKAPKTADATRSILWIILFAAAALAVAAAWFFLRRPKGTPGKPRRGTGSRPGAAVSQKPRQKEEPAILDAILGTEPPLREESSPTQDLVRDFHLNLDEFRIPDEVPPAEVSPEVPPAASVPEEPEDKEPVPQETVQEAENPAAEMPADEEQTAEPLLEESEPEKVPDEKPEPAPEITAEEIDAVISEFFAREEAPDASEEQAAEAPVSEKQDVSGWYRSLFREEETTEDELPLREGTGDSEPDTEEAPDSYVPKH